MKRLELLDYGRFFAAIIVVAFHYTFNGIANGKITSITHIPILIEVTKYGYFGVELFFMISGYVIFFSAKNRSASKFAVSRAVRLYPAYWFAILFTSLFAFQWGGSFMSVYPNQVIANFSMFQSYFGIPNVDGVYWTLVYEVQFYFLVFLFLFLGLKKYLNTIFICWPVLFCLAIILKVSWQYPYLGTYYYYFCAGALFAILADKFNWKAVFSLIVVYVLCVHYSSGKAESLSESRGIEYSAVTIGMIITSFFAFFVYQISAKAQSLRLPMSRILGALTYPVYLIHAHFGYMFLSQFATEENKLLIYFLTISIVLAVSAFIHFFIEKRFSLFWKSMFDFLLGKPLDTIQGSILRIKKYVVSTSP